MSKSYEYDVTCSTGAGETFTETVEGAAGFADTGEWTAFHNDASEVIARFRNFYLVSVVRGDEADPNPTQDTAA